jgi:hypothetical protein
MAMVEPFVHSFHINVLDGDAAFHLLVDESTKPPTILSTVLIDGGHRHLSFDHRDHRVTQLSRDLAGSYKDTSTPVLRCDTIVITHWDEDHYGGILRLIENSINSDGSINDGKSVFKYEGGNRAKPQTYLYVPCAFYKDHGTFLIANLGEQPLHGRWQGDEILVDFASGKPNQSLGICKLRTKDILGVNFFTNKPLPSGTSSEGLKSPEDLVKANKPTLPNGASSKSSIPGLYCVGSNTDKIGYRIDAVVSMRTRAKMKQIGTVDIVNRYPTASNCESIAAMLIWDNSFRLSHYTAGDLDFDDEGDIVAWTKTNGDTKTVGKWVTSMKVSHHGGRNETPATILENFRSRNIIISCGGKYGHPGQVAFIL